LRKPLRLTAGFGLVLLGVIGWVVPVMPGWVFVISGLLILSDYFPPVKRLLDWAKRKAAAAVPGNWRPSTPPAPGPGQQRKNRPGH